MSISKILDKNIPTVAGLLIAPYLDDFIEVMKNNHIVILDSPTGSGKTMGVTSAIASIGNRIMVAVPTVALGKNNLKNARDISPDVKYGSALEGNIEYDNNTEAIFATYGHVKNKMVKAIKDGNCSDMNFVDVLMIDEAHHGSVDNLLIKSLWKYCYNQGVKMPRLILSSATIDPNEFPGALLFKIEVPSKPVMVLWHNKNYKVDDKKLIVDTAEVAMKFDALSDIEGNFVIFVPGVPEMTQLQLVLEKRLNKKKTTVHGLCGRSTPEEKALALSDAEIGKRKIILCTNAIEAGVTIKNLVLIIDMMIEKVPELNSLGGTRLRVKNETKFSAIQRKGRVGRLIPGYCYRMCTEKFYERLEERKLGDITRIPIERILLEIYGMGLDPFVLLQDMNIPNMKIARRMLENLGMLRLTREEGYYPTDLGFFGFELPIGVRPLAFLWQWWKSDLNLIPGIVLTAIMDSYGPSYFEGAERKPEYTNAEYNVINRNHTEKFHSKFIGRTDLHSYYNFWLDLVNEKGLNPSDMEIEEWSKRNSMNNSKVKEVRDSIDRITNRLISKYNIDENILRTLPKEQNILDTDTIMIPALDILSRVFFDQLSKLDIKNYEEKKTIRYIMPTVGEVILINDKIHTNLLLTIVPEIIIPLSINVVEARRSGKISNVSNFTVDIPKEILITKTETGIFPEGPQIGTNVFTRLPGDLDILTHINNLTNDNYNDIPYIISQSQELQKLEFEDIEKPIQFTNIPKFVREPKDRLKVIYEPTLFERLFGIEKVQKIKSIFYIS